MKLSAAACVVAVVALAVAATGASAAFKTWTGIGGDGQWANAANWNGGVAPVAADDVLLDNSFAGGSYSVTLPIGATTVSILRLTITPSGANIITLTLPIGNTAVPGFSVGDATAGTDDIILNAGAVLRNSTGAASGNGIEANTTASGTVRINNGGKYVHNTARSTAGVVPLLSTAAGTETGEYEQDNPGSGSVAISASGRTYGSLTLTRSAGPATYSSAGGSALTVRGNFKINPGVTYSTTMTGPMNVAGNFTNNGSALSIPASQTVVISSSSAQTITGTAPITFASLTVGFIGGGMVTISSPVSVTGLADILRLVSAGGNLTVTGTLQLESSASIIGSPIYTAGATLVYGPGGPFSVGSEWGSGTSAGVGVPTHVSLVPGAGTVNMPPVSRTCPGNLTIGGGTLVMNGSGGDLFVGGNWSRTAGTFTDNGRPVHFNGSGAQSVAGTPSESFFDVFFDASGGPLTLSSPVSVLGTAYLARAVNGGNNLTVNNKLQREGSGTITGSPSYGTTSSLVYGSGLTFLVGDEWGAGMSAGVGVPVHVYLLPGAGTVVMPSASRTCPGNLTLSGGTLVMNGSGGDLSVGGNWSRTGGTFTHSGRAVHFNGPGPQSVAGTPSESFFDVFFDASSGSLSLSSPVTVAATAHIARPVTGGSNLAVGTALFIEGSGTISGSPSYGSSTSLVYSPGASRSVGDEWGPGTSVGVGVPSKISVISGPVTMPTTDRTCPGDLSLTASLQMNPGGGNLSVGGNWVQSGGGAFNPATRTVRFFGPGTQIISTTATTPFFDVIFDGTSNSVTLAGPISVSGTARLKRPLLSASNMTVAGTGTLEIDPGGSVSGTPVYSGSPTLFYNTLSSYIVGPEWGPGSSIGAGVPKNVSVQGSGGTVTMPGSSRTVPGTLTITNGTLLLGSTLTVMDNATISPGGFLKLNNKTFNFRGPTLTNNGSISGPLSTASSSFLTFAGSAMQLYQGGGDTGTDPDPLAILTVSKPAGGVSISLGSTIRVNHVVLFQGNVTNSNRLRIGSSGVASAVVQIGNGLPPGTVPGGSFDVSPDYSNLGLGGLILSYAYENVARTTGPEIPGTRSVKQVYASNFNGVTIAGGTLQADLAWIGDGTLAVGTFNSLRLTPGGSVQTTGSGNLASGSAGGRVEFIGSGTVTGLVDFNDVRLDGGLVDFGTGSTIHGVLSIAGLPAPYARATPATPALPVLYALADAADGGSPVMVRREARDAAAPQGVGGGTPPTYATGSTLSYMVSYNVAGEWVTGSSGPGVPYHVEVMNGTLDFSPDASSTSRTARGNITIFPPATLKLGSSPGGDLVLYGGWSRSGTFTPNGRVVYFLGASAQSVTGATTFDVLKIDNPAGVTLGAEVTVNGTLSLVNGKVSTGANMVVISGTGSVTRASGHVDGNLQKRVGVMAGAGSATFEIGDGSFYTPVDFSGTGLTQPFDLTARTSPGDHSNIGSSGLDATKSVNRTYTMTRGAIDPAGTYDLTFHFDPADVDGPATPADFVVGKYDGGWTRPTLGTRTPTSTQVTGLSSFSDYQIAEALQRTITLTIIGGGSVLETPSLASYPDGSIVQLDATPNAGWSFSGWTGSVTSGANPLFLTMDANKSLTATFSDVAAPMVHVTAPNGGEVWTVGTLHTITWTATDNAAVTTVDLDYSTDGGTTYPNTIATGIGNSGSYAWILPNTPGTTTRVRVTAHDAAANAGDDAGDANFEIQVVAGNNTLNAGSPAQCLSNAHACVTVPVTIARDNALDIRAFSVKVTLSAELALCAGTGSITEGTYLSAIAGTSFLVTPLGGNQYQVDGAILGPVCGATAATGSLFDIAVKPSGGDGAGTVTLGPVTLRDCSNAPLPSTVGTMASITIDHAAPLAVADLAVAQQLTGNDTDGTTKIGVSYTVPGDATVVEVYRKGFGGYPGYDDAGGSVPAPPGYPPTGWTPVPGATPTGVTDEPGARDSWYYAVFTRDACGNVSAVSNPTGGALDYHLGDIASAGGPGTGENAVDGLDLSLLGAHYGISGAAITTAGVRYLDVGPTTDLANTSRPVTDDAIDFEDLIVCALDYGVASSPQFAARAAKAAAAAARGDEEFRLVVPSLVVPGQTASADLVVRGAGRMQGFSVRLAWDATVVEPIGMTSGGFVESREGVVLSSAPGTVDAALLGVRTQGLEGEGQVASVSFRALRAGSPGIRIERVIARDASNRAVGSEALAQSTAAERPAETLLLAPTPNPFRGRVALGFSLAEGGAVDLAVYDVNGRLVRTLARGTLGPGVYPVVWEGTDDAGRAVAPGIYYARLATAGHRFTKRLVCLR